MKKIIGRIILGLLATGTVATASVVTTTKIIENKKEENIMTKEVQSTSVENQNGNNTENIVENIIINSTENKSEESNNNEIIKPTTNTQITTKQPTISTQPVETVKVEQEKEIICTIDIIKRAKDLNWNENIPKKIRVQLKGENVYNQSISDFSKDITITLKGTGCYQVDFFIDDICEKKQTVDFSTQTNIIF